MSAPYRREVKRRLKRRQFENGEGYREALHNVWRDVILSHLGERGGIDVAGLASKTRIKPTCVVQVLDGLAREHHVRAMVCGECRSWGSEASCARCGELGHSACLLRRAQIFLCSQCAQMIESDGGPER